MRLPSRVQHLSRANPLEEGSSVEEDRGIWGHGIKPSATPNPSYPPFWLERQWVSVGASSTMGQTLAMIRVTVIGHLGAL